jgi:hypothetical protein
VKKIMAKKSKPSGKAESKPVGKTETITSVKEETPAPGKDGGKIDFFYLMNGAGVLIGIIYIIYIILHYVLHIQ